MTIEEIRRSQGGQVPVLSRSECVHPSEATHKPWVSHQARHPEPQVINIHEAP
jgi:hypothetical protein